MPLIETRDLVIVLPGITGSVLARQDPKGGKPKDLWAISGQALWQAVGEAMARRVGSKPVWLSTAGAGVSWLHMRLDDRPKYYAHSPYRRL